MRQRADRRGDQQFRRFSRCRLLDISLAGLSCQRDTVQQQGPGFSIIEAKRSKAGEGCLVTGGDRDVGAGPEIIEVYLLNEFWLLHENAC